MTGMFRSHRQRGVTLLELMIVIAVIGILGAIAYPSYTGQIAKTRRGAAQGCLSEYAQFLERNFTLALRYDQTSAGADVTLPALQCSTDLNGSFTFASNLAATTYAVSAVPTTKQASADSGCGCTLTLNQVGAKGVSSCSKPVTACW